MSSLTSGQALHAEVQADWRSAWFAGWINSFLVLSAFCLGFNAVRVEFLTLGDVFLLLAAGLKIVTLVFGVDRRVHNPGKLILLSFALFVFAFILSALTSDGSSLKGNLGEFLKLIMGLFLTCYIFADSVKSEIWLRRIFIAYVLSAAINASIGLIEFVGIDVANAIGAQALEGDSYIGIGRARGLTLHPNLLGLTCAVAFPLVFMMKRRTIWSKVFQLLVGVLIFAGVAAAGSRAALLAVFVSGVIIFGVSTTAKQKFVSILFLPIVGIVLFLLMEYTALGEYITLIVALQRFIDGLNGAGRVTDSNDERLGHLRLAAENIDTYPIAGAGFEWIQHAHSIYVQVVEAAGFLGAAALLLYIASFAFRYLVALGISRGDRLLSLSALSVLAYLVSGIASNSLYTRPIILPFALLWAACNVVGRNAGPSQNPVARCNQSTP